MRFAKLLLLALGFYILYYTIKDVGVDNIIEHIAQLRWSLLPVLIVYPFIFLFDTIGWAFAFPRNLPKHVPLKDLLLIRVIGEMLNAVIPFSASLGGEPIKAEMLKRRHGIPLAEGYASLLIVHTTFWVALNLFVIGGILVTVKTMPLTPILWNSVLAFLVGLGLTAGILIIGLHFGIFKKVHQFGEKFKWWKHDSEGKKTKFLELDKDIKKFYTEDRRNFYFSVFWNFLGWFAGTFEVYMIARLVGLPIGFAEAWLLESLIQVLRIVTFFIPSSIGVQEGGIVLIFEQFGFASGPSLTFALIRRLREILWIGLGLTLWSFLKEKKAA